VIGTSIGAIDAGIIAGNWLDQRLQRLQEFWRRMRYDPVTQFVSELPGWGVIAASAMTMMAGVRGFFAPNPWACSACRWLPRRPAIT